MSKVGAFIPARYAATRFPAKLMQPLGDKTVIRHTYDNTKATGLFDEVYVVTDSEIIFNEIVDNGGKAIMSKRPHESGSDRIAEAIVDLAIDIVVNVQGDEPFFGECIAGWFWTNRSHRWSEWSCGSGEGNWGGGNCHAI